MVKAASILHQDFKRIFACMAEWRVADIMRKCNCLDHVFVQSHYSCNRPCDLVYFQCMSQPCPIIITFMIYKNLRFVFQPPKSSTMYNPIPVSLVNGSMLRLSFRILPTLRLAAIHGIGSKEPMLCSLYILTGKHTNRIASRPLKVNFHATD